MSQLIIPSSERKITHIGSRTLSGEMETVAIEDVGDKRIYHYAQRTDEITNSNELRRKEEDTTCRTGEFHQVASVPYVIWNLWETMGITADQRELRKAIERYGDTVKVTNKRVI